MKIDLYAMKNNLLQLGLFKRITFDIIQYLILTLSQSFFFTFRSAGFGFNIISKTVPKFL